MTWGYIISEAIAALRFNRTRTLFTITSLGWGVACFVILMSYGDGFDRALTKAFNAVGQDLIITFAGQTSEQAGGLRAGRHITLDLTDAAAVKETVPEVAAMSPEIMKYDMKANYRGREKKDVAVRAVYPEYQDIRNIHISDGRWINEDDRQHRNRFAVLGSKIAKDLFSGASPIDEEISINGTRFTVIGVLDAKLQIANYNTPDNNCIFIPYDTFSVFGNIQYPWFLIWKSTSPETRDRAIQLVRAKLADLHRFNPKDEKAVEILAFGKFMTIISGMSLAVKALLGFVGALTLAIGGVGLANIMLAAVIDRTREIGMMKALGGQRKTIRRQFLLEASFVVLCGGALGVGLGVIVTKIIGSMPFLGPAFKDTTNVGDIYLSVSPMSVLISTGVLLIVGLIAGTVPAIKASRMDPIEALRYE
jgi:putative ABC transport system permease protein